LLKQAARRAEAELDSLHDKIAELESSVNNSRTLTPRKVSDVAQKDAMGLLQNIYIKVAKICGIEVNSVSHPLGDRQHLTGHMFLGARSSEQLRYFKG
jgi:hypothetical protein